jgi:hypothetical protein
MMLASFMACQRREVFLGRADSKVLAQGIEVHLTHGSEIAGFEGLRWSPGRALNLNRNIKKE